MLSTPEIKLLNFENLPPKGSGTLSWILYFIAPYKKVAYPYLIYRILRFTTFSLYPTFIGILIDLYQKQTDLIQADFETSFIFSYLTLYTLFLISPWIFKYESLAYENSSRGLALLGLKILNHLPLSWHIEHSSGRKLEIINDARRGYFELMVLFRWQMLPVIGSLISSVVMVGLFKGPAYYSISLVAFTFTYLLCAWHFGKPLFFHQNQYKNDTARIIAKLYEFASSALTVKSLALENYLEKTGLQIETKGRDSAISIYNANFFKWTIINILTACFVLFFCLVGYHDLKQGALSTGAYSGLLMLFIYLWSSLEGLSVSQDRIADYLTAVKRFRDLADELRGFKPESSSSTVLERDKTWEKLSISDLSFRYTDKQDLVLKGINLNINKGERVAIVGESGAGKTTLIKLLLRLYPTSSGRITLDKVDISKYQIKSWLNFLAYVPQEIELFDGTIKENILLGMEDLDEEKYKKVLLDSGVYKFINLLEEKDLTVIGERGLKLSGGQRQRIGIARALLRRAEIIILDEATSALDSLTEKEIQKTIFDDLKSLTVIIIAHRLSTIKESNKIIVLDKGEVVEMGQFTELREKGGKFTEMWESARI